MRRITSKALSVSAICTVTLFGGTAAGEQVPLKNWKVESAGALRTTLGDAGPPAIFVPFTPCRMVDTRGGGVFTGSYGPPALPASTTRDFPMTSASGPCPGIPTGAKAISLNVTVTGTLGAGFIMMWPAGGTVPTVSTLNYSGAGQTIANAAIVPMSASGSITAIAGVSGTHLILDVNGYFIGGSSQVNDNTQLKLRSNTPSSAIVDVVNTAAEGNGGIFETLGEAPSIGLIGYASSPTGAATGVKGYSAGGVDGAVGVYGSSSGSTGQTFGVKGSTSSTDSGAAGVFGRAGSPVYPNDPYSFVSGVLGNATTGIGVLGKATTGRAVQGSRVDATTGVGVGSGGALGYTGSYGVFSFNDVGAVGTKSFVEPHPTDAARQIVYVALEGPEAGTYFRGRGRFQGGRATIAVPEDFRLVTEEEGLTVQISPIGQATAWLGKVGLEGIEARSTADVEFYYLVNGVRRNYRSHQPIQANTLFVPEGFGARMETYPAHIQKRLVDLGIYNADGTVNLATAERMGWAERWRQEDAARKAEAEKATAKERDDSPARLRR